MLTTLRLGGNANPPKLMYKRKAKQAQTFHPPQIHALIVDAQLGNRGHNGHVRASGDGRKARGAEQGCEDVLPGIRRVAI